MDRILANKQGDADGRSAGIGRGVWVATLLAGVLAWMAIQVPSASAKPLQILLLGDSITASEAGRRSFRYYLWRRLVDEKFNFDFVGTQHLNDGGLGYWPRHNGLEFDPDHEAHVEWRIDHIVNGKDNADWSLETWLEGYTPDIAVVMLGTHDALQEKKTEWSEREMRRVLELLRVDNERVAILLVTPPPSRHRHAEYLKPLSQAYADLAAAENTVNSPVRLVDIYNTLDPEQHLAYDGVQPNDAGERLIAGAVASALMLLDEAHLDPLRRTTARAWGAVLVVPVGAAVGFFLLGRSQIKREHASSIYHFRSRDGSGPDGGGSGGGISGFTGVGRGSGADASKQKRASRVSGANGGTGGGGDDSGPLAFPGVRAGK